MFDSRFPQLHRVREAPGITPELRAKAVAFSDAVLNRVPGAKCAFNKIYRTLYFYYDIQGGPVSVQLEGSGAWPLDQRDVDDVVAMLNLARVPWEERDREQKIRDANTKQDEELAKEKMQAERRPALQHHADFLSRRRRGMTKTTVYTGEDFAVRPSGLIVPHESGAVS